MRDAPASAARYNTGRPTQFGKFGMAERYNEGKAIDAVLRRIEAREATLRHGDGWSPDDQQDSDKDRRVDYLCTVGKQLYAFEHTGIEPFENQIKMEVDNQKLLAPVMAYFHNGTPVGEYWELHTPVEALRPQRRKDQASANRANSVDTGQRANAAGDAVRRPIPLLRPKGIGSRRAVRLRALSLVGAAMRA
jgi:hypothetical protein